MSFFWLSLLASTAVLSPATAFTGSSYQLSHEYSGLNFFDGWDFYTGRDPTGGFVTYYSRSASQLTGLINTVEDGPAYMGVNSVDLLPFNAASGRGDGAGRPSVRIASKQAFTHGLFIGDFQHIPAGICGTWPAFWTLGPNWPYTGEIDIMEGVNQNTNNIMSLHTNTTCTIEGDSSVMTGQLGNKDCAYYPDYNVGCGVSDTRKGSFGSGFNQGGGGVYAMQWTSESILIWYWPRAEVPTNVDNKTPDPSSWGLPAARLAVGNCTVDQHFQSHKIIFDTTFCGEYAGNQYVWDSTDGNSCKASTGAATCDQYVANNPAAFKDAYWSVNYVRVYQLADPADTGTRSSYLASEQPVTLVTTAPNTVATPNLQTDSLCPQYNFTIISDGKYKYEVACDFDPPGPDLIGSPYPGFRANSMADCIAGCSSFNTNNGSNTCGGVAYKADIKFCYFKKYVDGTPNYRPGFNLIRLIYYGYPQITDDPRKTADSTFTSVFVETIPTPQTYRPLTSTSKATAATTSAGQTTTSFASVTLPPAMGDNSTTTATLPDDYSETVTRTVDTTTPLTPAVSSNGSSSVELSTSPTDSMGTSSTTRIVTPISSSSSGTSVTTSIESIGDGISPSPASSAISTALPFSTGAPVTSSAGPFDSSSSTIITSTDPTVTNAEFYILFKVDATSKLAKRATRYLSFDSQDRSILVETEEEATKFSVAEDGSLKAGTQFVALDSTAMALVLRLSDEKPGYPILLNVDGNGNVMVPGVDQYCLTQSGALAVVLDGAQPPTNCRTAEPELISTEDPVSPISTTSGVISFSNPGSSTAGGISLPTSRSSSASTALISDPGSSSTNTLSTTPTSSPNLLKYNDFVYAGCFGIPSEVSPAALPSLSIPLVSDTMTNERCTAACKTINAYYSATHEKQCLCSTSMEFFSNLLDYPDAACNTPCPGSNREFCGGTVLFESTIPTTNVKKRQNANLVLVSLYKNTLLLPAPGQNGAGTTTTSSLSGSSTTPPTSTGDVTFPPDLVSYDITGTDTATIVSTTYVDICNICPGGLTTRSTTITVPYCGCTATYDLHLQMTIPVPSPVVPMVTTVKNCEMCGSGGIRSTITVTVPYVSGIEALTAQVTKQAAVTGMVSMAIPAAAGAAVGGLLNNQPPQQVAGAASAVNQVLPVIIPSPSNFLPGAVAGTGSTSAYTTPEIPANTKGAPVQGLENLNAAIQLAAAPASPPSIADKSATVTSGGSSSPGPHSNSSTIINNVNGTTPINPIQRYSASSASRLSASIRDALDSKMRYVFSLGVAVVALGAVGVW